MKALILGKWTYPAVAVLVAAVIILLPLMLHRQRSLPGGTDIATDPVPVPPASVRLLIDDTSWDEAEGRRVIRQEIFDEMLAMIHRADSFVLVDLFLWNPWTGAFPDRHRELSTELAEALIRKKRTDRDVDILVLSDPINRIYGADEPSFFKDMAKAGIPVVFTDLSLLPDSNRFYAPYWSILERILDSESVGPWAREPRLTNPFERGGERISLLQFGRLLLFKANHRKVLITGSSEHGLEMLMGSLNPADGSSAHSNMALHVSGKAVLEALYSELEVLRWSLGRKLNVIVGATGAASFKAGSIQRRSLTLVPEGDSGEDWPRVQLLTEGSIATAVVELLSGAGKGDEVRIALFYLSDRRVVQAIKGAVRRGASVRLVLDANRDAFGMRKVGVPNRQVAAELMELSGQHSVAVRWADTHGEQFHTKSMSITYADGRPGAFTTGSANWTRRNIANLNLEANLLVTGADSVMRDFNAYFDRIWDNADGLSHTLPYGAWQEKGLRLAVKGLLYRWQEWSGMGTF
ncbi:MAG: hypothetical protein JSV00_03565 [bacterium]|nr:MAG: hypothetical protein JSV00_03565 [bacterium]